MQPHHVLSIVYSYLFTTKAELMAPQADAFYCPALYRKCLLIFDLGQWFSHLSCMRIP